ncbi:MAG TPA: hypothetical protein VF981_17985 [Gemmatimonadaceae bacterium]
MPYERERQFYRLRFPPDDLAEFLIGQLKMPIHEASERGIRYEPVAGHEPEPGDDVMGTVVFKRVGKFPVRGTMSRRQESTIVVVLEPPGLPYSAVMAEQLYLRKRYPERFAG